MGYLQLLKTVPDGIQVWLLEFNPGSTQLSHDWSLLSADEQVRAQRFLQQQDRVRFIATRAALRRLLAERVMASPDTLKIEADQFGKPRLPAHPDIKFNISHAGSFALIALSTLGEIGVDIEQCHRDVTGLDRHVLSPTERAWKLWPVKHFIELWVVKEAVLKALGFGIADHLRAITVLPNGDGSYCIAHDLAEWSSVSAWSIDAPAHYKAALALIKQSAMRSQSNASLCDC
ncbi:4'-phosphopantetheinyl transferase superfamily protein [Nitrosomonas sp. Nm166]|uniref:4'-phosphopantetheinyl transferase family protein n=1 Tax=Nitrosomonas sp. Nm166 TaxID=1881054 RepID=UPI0008EC88C5|nr:4'-phosphopantetheinyl transferase superfamily protein [Nitrosomonas sp. Nm166]SFE79949.1 4'-phosphopantetheinyl transferase [Nitrosomonas sp. Nm166]